MKCPVWSSRKYWAIFYARRSYFLNSPTLQSIITIIFHWDHLLLICQKSSVKCSPSAANESLEATKDKLFKLVLEPTYFTLSMKGFKLLISFLSIFPVKQDVELIIRGRSVSGQTISIRQETTVQDEETQVVLIRIGDLGEGTYSLTARGSAPLAFDQVCPHYSIFFLPLLFRVGLPRFFSHR